MLQIGFPFLFCSLFVSSLDVGLCGFRRLDIICFGDFLRSAFRIGWLRDCETQVVLAGVGFGWLLIPSRGLLGRATPAGRD